MILKKKKIVVLSHCILNQNTVVEGWQRAPGAYALSKIIVDSGIGLLQLPCPEFFMHNLARPGLSYDDYNTGEFRSLSNKLLEPIIWQIQQYISHGFEITGLIGINESPSCSLTGQTGVFMEILFHMLEENGISIRRFEVPPDYGTDEKIDLTVHNELKRFLEI